MILYYIAFSRLQETRRERERESFGKDKNEIQASLKMATARVHNGISNKVTSFVSLVDTILIRPLIPYKVKFHNVVRK